MALKHEIIIKVPQSTLILPLELMLELDDSVGRSVALVSAAATETVVKALAESADDAADAGPHQE